MTTVTTTAATTTTTTTTAADDDDEGDEDLGFFRLHDRVFAVNNDDAEARMAGDLKLETARPDFWNEKSPNFCTNGPKLTNK